MERLEIRNFLTIKEADIDVKRFTVLIGPQASGKSVIAKLLYFFRGFLNKQFVRSIHFLEDQSHLELEGAKRFGKLFPIYAWEKQDFSIIYRCGGICIALSNNNIISGVAGLSIVCSDSLIFMYERSKEYYKHGLDAIAGEEVDEEYIMGKDDLFWEVVVEKIYTSDKYAFRHSVFVPASRAFFVAVLNNIFSLLTDNVQIDPLMMEFGSVYQRSRKDIKLMNRWSRGKWLQAIELLAGLIEKIVIGKYVYEKGDDWILSDRGRINLSHASSGQQEVIPMLIVLLSRAYYSDASRPTIFFIEEPEAHLFPTAQRHVVEFLARLYNLTGCNYFITTHSPYILTALNNLVYAGNLARQDGLRERVKEIVPEEIQVSFDDVSAYTMEAGGIKSILDPELNIIGASVIDEVSNDFDAVFSKLLELEAAHD